MTLSADKSFPGPSPVRDFQSAEPRSLTEAVA